MVKKRLLPLGFVLALAGACGTTVIDNPSGGTGVGGAGVSTSPSATSGSQSGTSDTSSATSGGPTTTATTSSTSTGMDCNPNGGTTDPKCCDVDGGIAGGGCWACVPVNDSELLNKCDQGCIPFDESRVTLAPNGGPLPPLP